MKFIIILIVGIFIGTWFGLLFASFALVSKREEEMERRYQEDRERYKEQERNENDKRDNSGTV